MPASLRIPPKKEGKTKTAFILDAIDEKLGLAANREQLVRKAAASGMPNKKRFLQEDRLVSTGHEGFGSTVTVSGGAIPVNQAAISVE